MNHRPLQTPSRSLFRPVDTLTGSYAGIRRMADRRYAPQKVNFFCHLTEGVFASFGFELVAGGIIFPAIAAELGATPFWVGLLTSLNGFGILIAMLFAPRVEAYQQKKRLVLLLGIGQRLPFFITPILLLTLAASMPMFCLLAIALVNLMSAIVVSVLVPPWMDLIAETIPENRVGRLFGFRNGLSSTLGLFSGAVCSAILVSMAFPGNYVLLYVVACASLLLSWLIFALVDEVPQAVEPKEVKSLGRYFRDLLAALRDDPVYRRFLVYQGVSRLGFVAMPFYALAAVTVHAINPALIGGYIAARAAAQIVGNFAFPFIGEKIGHKRMLGIGAGFHAIAALVAAFAPSGVWFTAVFFFAGLGMAAKSVAGSPFMLQVCPRGKRIGYMTLSMAALAPVGMLAAPVAGFVMGTLGHGVLFGGAAAFMVFALLPLERCRPDRGQ